jgi:hypothetical protein
VHRVAARNEQPEQRVPTLVVGGTLAVGRVEQDVARRPECDLLHGLGEVAGVNLALILAGGEERRLVHQVAELGTDQAGRFRGEPLEIDVGGEGDMLGVDLEDRGAAGRSGPVPGAATPREPSASIDPRRRPRRISARRWPLLSLWPRSSSLATR